MAGYIALATCRFAGRAGFGRVSCVDDMQMWPDVDWIAVLGVQCLELPRLSGRHRLDADLLPSLAEVSRCRDQPGRDEVLHIGQEGLGDPCAGGLLQDGDRGPAGRRFVLPRRRGRLAFQRVDRALVRVCMHAG